MPNKDLPPIDKLLEAMSFCPMSGNAYWKRRPEHHFPNGWSSTWNTRYAGKKAGTPCAHKYLKCAIDKSRYAIHRLMWYVHNGPIPNNLEIDHINGNRQDNRLQNLRLATDQQNGMNRGLSIRNKSGHSGVYWNGKREKWTAKIRVSGRLIDLGEYRQIGDAVNARKQAEENYFGNFKRQDNAK